MNKSLFLRGTHFFFLLCVVVSLSMAQRVIRGRVYDAESKETIIGAWVVLADTAIGTITNFEGVFELSTDRPTPVKLKISFIGYQPIVLTYYGGSREISIYLAPDWGGSSGELVVSASRSAERVLETPVSVQKMGLQDIKYAPTPDFFSHLSSLKDVQINVSSFALSSINTRGFADIQNWRFVQMIDGVDMALPGLGFSIGNVTGVSELDLHSVELVPGTTSALYGPNAFNGLLTMSTKNPFEHEGLSFFLKSGAIQQESSGDHPYAEVGLRIAKNIKDKWAFKFNMSYLDATDWLADDASQLVTPATQNEREEIMRLSPGSPNYNGVNSYGDDSQVPVDLLGNGNIVLINRSGFREDELVDYGSQIIRGNAAVHFRPSDKIEISYAGRFVQADAILRHSSVFPLVNFITHSHKLELETEHLQLKSYYSGEDSMDSYSLLVTGAFIQEGLKPSSIWGRDYALAFQGRVPGIAGGNHISAREFADQSMAEPSSPEFEELRQLTINNPDILSLGSKFIDKSSLLHTEGNYDFSHLLRGWDLQLGGSVRRYLLNSEGKFFNDGLLGFQRAIPVWEGGGFVQGGTKLVDEQVLLTGALRYDKNQNFNGRLSSRAAIVFSLGCEKNHNIRLSAQSGFRNPSAQESYVYLDGPDAVLLGGVQENIERFSYFDGRGNLVAGSDIFEELVSLSSYQAFEDAGGTNPVLLEKEKLSFLRQEQIFSLEAGYKALLLDRLFVDMNVYRNLYRNFVSPVTAYSPLVNRAFTVYTNINEPISSLGAGIGMSLRTAYGLRISGSYTYAIYDADSARNMNPSFVPGFNMPTHRASAQLQHRNLYKGLGFSLAFRWSDTYLWESSFGVGEIDSYQVLDAALHYVIPNTHFLVKVGASNLLNHEYQTIYGGPRLGRQYFVSLTFDPGQQ